MKTQRISFVLVFVLMLGLASVAHGELGSTEITWSSWLIDGNEFLDGEYDLRFRLFDAFEGGSKLGSDAFMPDVNVSEGYFSGSLDFGIDICDGQTRYVEIAFRPGNMSDPYPYTVLDAPRQEVLRTHHTILAEKVAIGTSYPEPVGLTVQGNICMTMGNNLILKAADYDAGDIIFRKADGIQRARIWSSTHPDLCGFNISSDSDNDPELYIDSEGDVGIGTKNPAYKLEVRGDVKISGQGGIIFPDGTKQTTAGSSGSSGSVGGFPRPNYDSGWVNMKLDQHKTLTHGLGGNVDNYVVDLEFKAEGPEIGGIHNIGIGVDYDDNSERGGYFYRLNGNTVTVVNSEGGDGYGGYAPYVRIRIWVYE